MVSVKPAVMGWPSPGHFRGSSAGTELPCSPMPQLQASLGSPTRSRETSLSPGRGTPCDCWFGVGWAVALGGVLSLALVVHGPWGLEKQWGGQAGVPGERSEGDLKSVGRGVGAGGHSRPRRALRCKSCSGVWLQQWRPWATWCPHQPCQTLSPGCPAALDGVRIVLESNSLAPTGAPNSTHTPKEHCWRARAPQGVRRVWGVIWVLSWSGVLTPVGLLGAKWIGVMDGTGQLEVL